MIGWRGFLDNKLSHAKIENALMDISRTVRNSLSIFFVIIMLGGIRLKWKR
jgi:hypothetical protein